jgi:replication-associated recombination protein RarA
LFGDSGTGKTTIAHCLAKQYSDDLSIIETLGRDTTVEDIRYWYEHYLFYRPMGDKTKGWTIIVNEAQDLSVAVQEYLLGFCEEVAKRDYITLILTSMGENGKNKLKDFCSALASRTSTGEVLTMNNIKNKEYIKEAVQYLQDFCDKENIYCENIEKILIACKGNIRAAIGRIASGADTDAPDVGNDNDSPDADAETIAEADPDNNEIEKIRNENIELKKQLEILQNDRNKLFEFYHVIKKGVENKTIILTQKLTN